MMKTTHNQDAQRPDAEALVAPGTIAPAALAVPAGSTWLPPVTLSPAEFDGHMPRVALDPQGGAVVVWLNRDPGVNGRERVQAVFRPAGGSFGEMKPIFDASNGQPTPQVPYLQVARDAQGNTLVVWTRSFSTSTSDRVQAAFIPAGKVSAVADIISEDGQEVSDPQVAFSRGGDALVVWRSFDGANSRIQAAFRPPGGSFGTPQTISDPGQDAFEPQLAFDQGGNTLAVWTRSGGTNRRVQAAFRPAGGSFGAAQTLSDEGQHAFAPQVAVDPQGNAIVIWDRSDGTNRHVQAALRPADGSFGRTQTLSAAGGSAFEPRIVFDSRGGAVVVWRQLNGANVRVQATFRQPGNGSFEPPQTISADGQSAGSPKVAIDGQGNAIAVWEGSVGTNRRIQAAVRRAGKQFQLPETISESGGVTSEPQLAIDGQGNPIVVWQRFDGTNRRIQAAFRAAAQTISLAGEDAVFAPQVKFDAHGNAVAIWRGRDDVNNRIQAAFRPAGGSFRLPQIISSAGQSDNSPEVAVDGQGNAVAIWERRDGTDRRIQAAFRPAGGSFGPPQTLSTDDDNILEQQLALDGQGSAVAVWLWKRDGANDRIQAALRPAGGNFSPPQTLSTGETIEALRLAVNGQGNALVVWERRDGTNDRIQAALRPAGGNFSPPQTLSATGDQVTFPQVAIDESGNAIVIWARFDGTGFRLQAAFRAVGGSFGPPQTLSAAGGDVFTYQIVFDPQGNALAIWDRSDDTDSHIQAAFRPAGGSFGPPQTISDPGQRAFAPLLAVDPQSNAFAIWRGGNGTNLRIQAAFRPAGGSFGPPQTISANVGGDGHAQQLLVDTRGNALAIWERHDGTNNRIQFAFRLAGGSFGPPQTLSDPGQHAFASRLAVDDQGNALAAWTRSDGTNSRVQVAFRPAGGSFGPP
jgi:hypothetical protein